MNKKVPRIFPLTNSNPTMVIVGLSTAMGESVLHIILNLHHIYISLFRSCMLDSVRFKSLDVDPLFRNLIWTMYGLW